MGFIPDNQIYLHWLQLLFLFFFTEINCPRDFFAINNEECFYEPVSDPRTYYEASEYCKAMGAKLANPRDHNIQALAHYLTRNRFNYKGK